MASFAKIKVGSDRLEFFFNLEAIESVDLKNRYVYTIGSDTHYFIVDEDTWQGILHYVKTHKCPDYMF